MREGRMGVADKARNGSEGQLGSVLYSSVW